MKTENIVKTEQKSMAPIYWKRPLAISHGEGAILYGTDGKIYIDLTSNYGVAVTGHSHPIVVKAIQDQAAKLLSCHGTFYHEARAMFLDKLLKNVPDSLTRAYLSNSGSETVEFAFKLARRSTGKTGFIAMMGGFHGKTLGSLSATWKKKYREPFLPLVPGFKHVPFGKLDRVKSSIDENTVAIITEPIQGESGIILPPEGFLEGLREICDESNILLIMDEIQTGMGRTGKFLGSEHWNVEPDILCLSKAVASGLPLGVTLMSEEIASKLKVGDHSSTFGGSPIPCAAASATLDVIREEGLINRAAKLGIHVLEKLNAIASRHPSIRAVRGKGLMVGVEMRFDVLNIILQCLDQGVLILDAGRNIIRLLPPLVIDIDQLDQALSILDEVIGEEEAERLRR